MTPKLKALMVEDLECKKECKAFYDNFCKGCGESIFRGQPFVFMGDQKMVCIECLGQMQEELER